MHAMVIRALARETKSLPDQYPGASAPPLGATLGHDVDLRRRSQGGPPQTRIDVIT
jgi:hypothetical protein